MDSTISTLVAENKSICLDIADFQSRVSDLEQRVIALEDHLHTMPEQGQELLFLRSKLIDLENRSCRDNVCFFGFPEHIEGTDIQAFLKTTLPTLTGLSFDSPLEFQRAHRLGLKQAEEPHRLLPIIACLLRHAQAPQLLTAARSQGPFQAGGYESHCCGFLHREKRTSQGIPIPMSSPTSIGGEIQTLRAGTHVGY
ncbi:hypothetical protein NDU88_002973 [Pleurodeles waltl]|uniref:Uncharacterized protein n=1 Tax=Pleurodeles waltl TaxID=8319 RepID=A0AAV7TMM4_PLEWA|nr:hypothetical protein NDU88_002973 [Pleurodeles waltl]